MTYNNHMKRLKAEFLLDPRITFLNHGSFGAVPRPVFRAYQRWQRELELQPVEFLGRRYTALMSEARNALGEYLGTTGENVVYVTNVTVAVNIVARSLNLGPGDEVLTTDHEYGACVRAWRFLAKNRSFNFIIQSIPVPLTSKDEIVENLWRGVTSNTKVIFLSHITSPTALIFPVEEICRRARQNGILTVVDGAHAPGQIPLKLDNIGADFYGANLHKWLCAPKGAGFLFARPEMQQHLEPLVVSWGYEAEKPSSSRFIDHHEYWGTRDIAAFLAVPEAIRFQEENDWQEVRQACHALAKYAQERITELTNLPALSSDNWYAQMTSVPLPDTIDPIQLKNQLYNEHQIEIPIIQWNKQNLIRISIQGYNTQRDVNHLVAALKHEGISNGYH